MDSNTILAPGTERPAGDIEPAAVQRLADWMQAEVEAYVGPLAVERFPGGQSNPTFKLVTPGRRYVLRRKPSGAVLASAHAVDREYRVIAALAAAGFPVPRVFGLCADEAVIGSMFYVMELVDGRILWDGRLPDMQRTERRAIYEAQLDTLAALHSLDPIAIGLEGFGKPGNYFARQVSRWTKQYRASDAPRNDDMERLIAWLPDTVPPETPARVVHGDYRLDNMVLDADAPRVRADLTYWLMHWVTPAHERNSLSGLDLAVLGIPSRDDALARYLDCAGAKLERPLEWYLAYNLFRLAAILQGVAGRAKIGQANNERALQAQGRVAPLAASAWSFAQQAGARP
jgi:aminoglycoside phosphotransferase (APT) family kinase protein